ncbi:chromosome partitioning protein ParB [Legionella busanensis]|uniref:Chromosome partitioning protein ParB n=1 Tax=Legionella busanensis TaxID=190655 RepID=A0A378KA90_9GAMM|nr:ParB/RepB/Spo0J family partition protein [Legionella busanensis]STX81240.1 chromosome partitioning protein ParB [Legionella busanensis]
MSTDFLSNIVSKMQQTQADLDLITKETESTEKVVKKDPCEIGNWEFRDRQEFELGDIEALSISIASKGQAQPIILVEVNDVFRAKDNAAVKYVVIAGYRRWLACKLKNIPVDSIIRKLSFEQAISCLVSENEKEKVSDYSKGMFYYSLLQKERVTKKTLYERLGINRSVFDNFLSFAEVPKEVWEAVKDMRNVSARSSATIKSICQKGEKEKNAIISIADKIALGIGEKKITALVNKIINENDRVAKSATRVAFSKNIFIEVKNDSLTLTARKIKSKDLETLQEKLSELLKSYIA